MLEVDGTPVQVSGVWIHHQRDPFPGGHTFRLRLPVFHTRLWLKWLNRSLPQMVECPDDDLSEHCLRWLALVLSSTRKHGESDASSEVSFVLNSITRISIHGEAATITGVCSDFVRGEKDCHEGIGR